MAAIEKIRKHSGLLIAIIGIALLAFVLQDLFQSTGRNREYNVAVVNGEKIPYQDFENQRDKDMETLKRQTGANPSSTETYRQYNNTLDKMIKDHIMNKEYEDLGINVSSDELYDMFVGDNPHQWVVQTFTKSDGTFDKELVENYLQNLNSLNPEMRTQWVDFERAVKEDRLTKKYSALVNNSYFVPTKIAELYYDRKNDKASAEIVGLRYTTIPDSIAELEVTDRDRQAFYDEYKYRYKTEEVRNIEYVVFDIEPSMEDRQDALQFIKDIKPEFTDSDNAASFVNANSDQRYDSTWMGRKDVPQQIEKPIFDDGNGIGYVFGPYEHDGSYNLVRIVDMQNRPDSLKASHILISYAGAFNSQATISKEDAKAKADSLLNVLRANSKNEGLFADLARQLSTDQGSKDKGGDLDWFTDGTMVNQFNEYVVNNPVGSIGVVETPFGYHIIKVTGKTVALPKARLAVLRHDISTSTKTYQNIFADVNRFVTENKTSEQFNTAIEEQGLNKRTQQRLRKSSYQIAGIDNPRQIIRWAFDDKTKVGDISNIFDLDNMFVVATLTDIIPEGYAPMSIVSEQAKYQILILKKGEMAVEKMKACGNDVKRMIEELGAESDTITSISLNDRVMGNFGVESDIIGTIFGMKEGQEVGPVAGNSSAFIIKNVKFDEAPKKDDFSETIKERVTQFRNKVLNDGIYKALFDGAKVEDNRVTFY